jgi:CBS domain-containing protein
MEQTSLAATRPDGARGLSRAQLEQLERLLLRARERTVQTIARFDEETRTSGPEADGGLSRFPLHAADQGSDAMTREVEFAIGVGTGVLFSQIQEALRLIYEEPERYGVCQSCGNAIPFERLEMIPWAQVCSICEATSEAAVEQPRGAANRTRAESRPLTLRQIMATDVFRLPPEATIREAAEMLAAEGISGAPVVRGERILGVVSASDILDFHTHTPGVPTERPDEAEWGEWSVSEEEPEGSEPPAVYFLELWLDAGADVAERFSAIAGPEWDVLSEHTVDEIMTRRLCALPPDTTLADAARYMLRARVHRVLVVEHGLLVGVVTTSDFLHTIAEGGDSG